MARHAFGTQAIRTSRLARRLVIPGVGTLVVAVLVAMPGVAQADPTVPPGASTTAPRQQAGSAAGRVHEVSASQTRARSAGPPKRVALPRVRGAVGSEVRHADPVRPPGAATQRVADVDTPAPAIGPVPGVSTENPFARTPYSTTFDNPDGTSTLRIYEGVTFVPDPRTGSLRRLEPRLTRRGDGRWEPLAAAEVSIAGRATDATLATLRLAGGTEVGFGLDAAAEVPVAVDDAVARFAGVRRDADLELSATANGVKEDLVLRSASAPTSWLFPLRVVGVTPSMDEASGSIRFIDDKTGQARATIPPGYMVDSNIHPRRGSGEASDNVRYTLLRQADGWALRVDLDAAWLADPARVFPVRVDPTFNTNSDDTYVSSRDNTGDNSTKNDLTVGTYNSGGEKAAALLHFTTAMSSLSNKYILGANLWLFNYWSYSCVSRPVTVHRVTGSWSGGTVRWPGPSYESTPLATRSFHHGYTGCEDGAWESFAIPANRFTSWTHNLESFQGFMVRASLTDSRGWKRFWSGSHPTTTARPYLDVTYANEGAACALATNTFNPPVSATQAGGLTIKVTNLGSTTWTPTNNYRLTYAVLNSSGAIVQNGPLYAMPGNVAAGKSINVPIAVGPITGVGTYTLRLDMVNSSGTSFHTAYSVPYGTKAFTIANGAPTVDATWPPQDARVDTLRPTLWSNYVDYDSSSIVHEYEYRICNGPPAAPVCQSSGTIRAAAWPVPAGVLAWNRQSFWQLRVSDTALWSPWSTEIFLTPTVAQPTVTSHLAGARDGADVPNVNPQVGNYARAVVDAQVNVAGPALEITRTYNSQDPRANGAFGAGWTSPLDQRVTADNDGSGNVVVTLANGRQMRFGKSPDATYAPPYGINLALVYDTPSTTWTLRDPSGTRRTFDASGRLTSISDVDGRTQTYTYSGATLTTVSDVASGRALHLTWSGGHVTAVATDPPAAGQPAPTWTYTYTGDRLTSACNPLNQCTTEGYTTSSHYRSAVLDDNPSGYWPLGEAAGATVATNVAAHQPAENDAAYNGTVTLGTPGALAGSADTAATFQAGSDGPVVLPDALVSSSTALAVELWFKATSGSYGYLFGEQNADFLTPTTVWSPMLYVGTDGKLRGLVPVASTPTPMVGISNKCADINGGSTANRTKIQVWTCNGTGGQAWSWYADGTLRALGKCMDIDGGGTANGTRVMLFTCHGGTNQVWQRYGTTGLRNPISGRCLHAATNTNGTQLVIQDCAVGSNQNWSVPVKTDPITTTGTVNDGNWHHVVLSGAVDQQQLYLDGALVGQITGRTIDHRGADKAYVGHGSATVGWPGGPPPATSFRFTGQVDEVAFYRHPLGSTQVSAHWAARVATSRLTTTAEPGPFVAHQVGYDGVTGRVTTLTDRNGEHWTLSAPELGTAGVVVTASSDVRQQITYTYDADRGGHLVAREDGFGTQSWEYNAAGFVSASVDQNGNRTDFATDDRGHVLARTTHRAADTNQTEYFGYFYDASTPLDPRNDVQVRRADARSADEFDTRYRTSKTLHATTGRVLTVTYPKPAGQSSNPTQSYTYTDGSTAPSGLPQTITARDGSVTSYGYNAAGDLISTTDAGGVDTTYTYDALGRALTATRSAGAVGYGTTTYTYDKLSRPSMVTGPGVTNPVTTVTHTAATTYTYDAGGRVASTSVADTTGGDPTRTTVYDYDPAGRLVSVTAPDGRVTTQEWNTAGDPTVLTPSGGPRLEYTYDDAHRVLETRATGPGVDPMNAAATTLVVESRAYDPAGQLATVVDAMGRETGYTYFNDGLPATTARVRRDANGQILPTSLTLASYTYDAAGLLASRTTAGSVTTAYTYDDEGGVATTTFDPGGLARVQTLTRRADGQVSRIVATGAESPGRSERVDYTYDPAGRLASSTTVNTGGSPASIVTSYVSDARGLLTQVTDPTGGITDYTHDKADRLVTTTGPARSVWVAGTEAAGVRPVTTMGYNTFGELTHDRDHSGATTSWTRDNAGRPTQLHRPAYTPPGGTTINAVEQTQYNARGLASTFTDALGRTTDAAYDPYGNLTSLTRPDPDGAGPLARPVTTMSYDRVGELLRTVDPTGAERRSTFNDLGLVATSTAAERVGAQTYYYTATYGYNDAGHLTSATSALGHVLSLEYNKAGEPTRLIDPTLAFTRYTRDLLGRTTASVAGKGSVYSSPRVENTYDLAGRATSVRQCTAEPATGACVSVLRTATRTYDGAGRVTQQTSAAGRPTYLAYDAAGQLTSITRRTVATDPGSAVTVAMGYDAQGRRSRTVDGNGNATIVTHNPWGLPESTIEPSTPAHPAAADRTWTTVYDAAGQAVRENLPGGVARLRTLDGLGRMTDETGTGATTTARHVEFDAAGRVTRVNGPAGDSTYTWNDRGLMTQATGPGGTSTFGYDADGRLTSRTDPSGAGTFGYDAAGRLTSVTDPLTGSSLGYTYSDIGRLTQITYGGAGGLSRAYGYDNLGRVTSDSLTAGGSAGVASATYAYDADDLLTSKVTSGVTGAGTNGYGYDGVGRLASWTRPDSAVITYGYDGASNRTGVTGPGGTRASAFDARNRQLTASGGGQPDDSYMWSARGTLATKTTGTQTSTYTFDAFERLTQAQTPSYTVAYAYDSLDRMAQRNGVAAHYADLDNEPVRNPSGADERIFRTPGGAPLSTKAGSNPGLMVVPDLVHDDVVAAVNPATAGVAASASYDPYGVPTTSGTLPLGYQGGWTDPQSGQVNAAARWYVPDTGAFASRDTWTLPPGPTTNRYAYGRGAPTVNADPNGHDPDDRGPGTGSDCVDPRMRLASVGGSDCGDSEPPKDGGDDGDICLTSSASDCSDAVDCWQLVSNGGGDASDCEQKTGKRGSKKKDGGPKPNSGGGGGGGGGGGHVFTPDVPDSRPRPGAPNRRPGSEEMKGGKLTNPTADPIEAEITGCGADCSPNPVDLCDRPECEQKGDDAPIDQTQLNAVPPPPPPPTASTAPPAREFDPCWLYPHVSKWPPWCALKNANKGTVGLCASAGGALSTLFFWGREVCLQADQNGIFISQTTASPPTSLDEFDSSSWWGIGGGTGLGVQVTDATDKSGVAGPFFFSELSGPWAQAGYAEGGGVQSWSAGVSGVGTPVAAGQGFNQTEVSGYVLTWCGFWVCQTNEQRVLKERS